MMTIGSDGRRAISRHDWESLVGVTALTVGILFGAAIYGFGVSQKVPKPANLLFSLLFGAVVFWLSGIQLKRHYSKQFTASLSLSQIEELLAKELSLIPNVKWIAVLPKMEIQIGMEGESTTQTEFAMHLAKSSLGHKLPQTTVFQFHEVDAEDRKTLTGRWRTIFSRD